MSTLIDLYALQSLSGVGDQAIRKIIRDDVSVSDLIHFNEGELKKYFSTGKAIDAFKNDFQYAKEKAEYEIEKIQNNGIEIVDFYSEFYPQNLSKIDDFPILLYCVGNKNLLLENQNIAVIGTRDNSEVGQQIARNTAYYFAQNGYTIVSGLAKGIDGIAHRAALEAKGKTIAVLVDVSKIYPKENSELARDIINNNGLLISENKPGSFQGKNSFVLRDRIQSGLSLAIFPIETDILGGTMHTVKYAQKQSRKIFVPNIFNEAIKSRYESTVGSSFSKLNGIRELIKTNLAIPYTKETYESVQLLLDNVSNSLRSFHGLSDIKDQKNHNSLFNSEPVEKNEVITDNTNVNSNEHSSLSNNILNSNDTSNLTSNDNSLDIILNDKVVVKDENNSNIQPKDTKTEKLIPTKSDYAIGVLISEFYRKFGDLMKSNESIIDNKNEIVEAFHVMSKNLKSLTKEKKNNKKDKMSNESKPITNNEIFPQ